MERGWKGSSRQGARSPISSKPIRRFGTPLKEENWHWTGVLRLTPTSKHSDPPALTASQWCFRPHAALKKRPAASSSRAKPAVHVVNLLGPQIQTSQLTLEKINTLLLLRTPKSDYIRRRYEPHSAKSTRPKCTATKDQSSCTPTFIQRALAIVRPKTTESRTPTRALQRHRSEEQLCSSALPFQNASIRDGCNKVPDLIKSSL